MADILYICDESLGVAIPEDPNTWVSWEDLSDALAKFFHPGADGVRELRRQLVEALARGAVAGRADLLAELLDYTAPRRTRS